MSINLAGPEPTPARRGLDLGRMLSLCQQGQWKVTDLDWSLTPRPLPRHDEEAIVQLFTDMAGIERLAKALFAEQIRRVEDPTLKEIFRTFVVDEERHAQAAERLARHYDVHRYRTYTQNPHLLAFAPTFIDAIRYLPDDVANVYITTGEVILDVALLRSINDHVHDEMSARAMELINRDESRHIAVDYHMVEYYASPAYAAREEDSRRQTATPRQAAVTVQAAWTFARLIFLARPFIQQIFFDPMSRLDPRGHRLREALKRVQVLAAKPGVVDRPFGRYLQTIQTLYHLPVVGQVLSGVLGRLAGLAPEYLARLNTDEELAHASGQSFQELADDVLAVKYTKDC
jgi:hypothetical protein